LEKNNCGNKWSGKVAAIILQVKELIYCTLDDDAFHCIFISKKS